MKKRGILGLPLSELIGIVLALIMIIAAVYVIVQYSKSLGGGLGEREGTLQGIEELAEVINFLTNDPSECVVLDRAVPISIDKFSVVAAFNKNEDVKITRPDLLAGEFMTRRPQTMSIEKPLACGPKACLCIYNLADYIGADREFNPDEKPVPVACAPLNDVDVLVVPEVKDIQVTVPEFVELKDEIELFFFGGQVVAAPSVESLANFPPQKFKDVVMYGSRIQGFSRPEFGVRSLNIEMHRAQRAGAEQIETFIYLGPAAFDNPNAMIRKEQVKKFCEDVVA